MESLGFEPRQSWFKKSRALTDCATAHHYIKYWFFLQFKVRETTFPRFSGTKFNCKWKSVFFGSQWALKDIPHCPSFLSNVKNALPTLGLQITEKTWEMLSFLNIYWKIEMSTTSFDSMIMSFEAYLTSKLASKNVAFQL